MLKYFGRVHRFMEVTEAIKRGLIGAYPPATEVSIAIQNYVINGGNVKNIILQLREDCLLKRQLKLGLDDWKY
jgi:hypothetical protein